MKNPTSLDSMMSQEQMQHYAVQEMIQTYKAVDNIMETMVNLHEELKQSGESLITDDDSIIIKMTQEIFKRVVKTVETANGL